MRSLLLAGALASATGAGAANTAPEAQVRIELRPLVQASTSEVTLGDVAALTTSHLPLLKKLMDLPLGPAPRGGETVRLARLELARWIRARTGLQDGQLEWSGPPATELQRAATDVSGERLAAAARETLRGWLATRSTRADIQVAAVPRDAVVPFGALAVRPRPIPTDQPIARRTTVWVDLWVDDRFVRTVPVGFDVMAWGPAYVATSPMPAGAALEPARFELREAELGGRAAAPLVPTGSLQLARPVAAGQVLAVRDVQARPAVARGDWVQLLVRTGAMALESRAEVLQNGAVGQVVSVKPRGATGALEARVLAPGRVEVGP